MEVLAAKRKLKRQEFISNWRSHFGIKEASHFHKEVSSQDGVEDRETEQPDSAKSASSGPLGKLNYGQCFRFGSVWIRWLTWIRFCIGNADPDPGARKIDQNKQINLISSFSKWLFLPTLVCFMTYDLQNVYFSCQNPTFCDGTVWPGSGFTWICIGLALWIQIRIRIVVKIWIQIRIQNTACGNKCCTCGLFFTHFICSSRN
jgi:hypothetical protein